MPSTHPTEWKSDAAPGKSPRWSRVPVLVLLLTASLAGATASIGHAQVATSMQQAAAPDLEPMRQREQELDAARAQQKSAAELREKLKTDLATIGQDRSKLNGQLIDIAAKVRGIETRIEDAETRLRPLDAREAQIRGSLNSRTAEIAEVLSALQRAGRRAPPALLVRPEDALKSLRTAMPLGAVVTDMRARAQKLVADLGELVTLRQAIATEPDQRAPDPD